MDIPIDALKELYQQVGDALIDKVNATPVTLYFKPVEPVDAGTAYPEPSMNDLLGGRTSIEYMPGRMESSGNNLTEIPTTGTIIVRAYWQEKMFEKQLLTDNVGRPIEICKIISYTSDLQALLNAEFIVVDNKRCKRESDGAPHGMFGDKRYATTYWKTF